MPATPYTELTVTQTGWTAGFADSSMSSEDDFFIDFLFEGTGFFAHLPDACTELSLSGGATPSTELTAPSVAWTELAF